MQLILEEARKSVHLTGLQFSLFTHALEHMQVVNIVLLQPKLRSQQILQVASQSIVCGSFFEMYSFQTHKKHLTTACPS